MPGKVVKMQQNSKDVVDSDKMFYSCVWREGFCYNWEIQTDECRVQRTAWWLGHKSWKSSIKKRVELLIAATCYNVKKKEVSMQK